MTMTAEEIVRHYNQAANKKGDITVLADLNLTDTASIRAILVDAGVLEPDKKRQRNLSKNATEGAPSAENPPKRRRAKGALRPGDGLSEPSPDPSLYDRIDSVLAAVPATASEYARACAGKLCMSLFSEWLAERLGLKELRV